MSGCDLVSPEFFEQVRAIVREGQHRARTSVNLIMVETYWRIGQRIVEEEQAGAARAD